MDGCTGCHGRESYSNGRSRLKTTDINKKSWHYQMARRSTTFPTDNLCDYFWQVFWGLAVTLFLGFFAGIFTIVLVLGLTIPYIAYFNEGVPVFQILHGADGKGTHWITIGMIVSHFLLVAIPVIFAIIKWKQYRDEKLSEYIGTLSDEDKSYYYRTGMLPNRKEPGFIALAYKNFKEKTCIKLNFVGDND